jgi:hypothetical protein
MNVSMRLKKSVCIISGLSAARPLREHGYIPKDGVGAEAPKTDAGADDSDEAAPVVAKSEDVLPKAGAAVDDAPNIMVGGAAAAPVDGAAADDAGAVDVEAPNEKVEVEEAVDA